MKITTRVPEIRAFHEDENGIEAIQVVMIVAIAAIVLIAVMTVGQEVFTWAKEKWDALKGKNIQ
jgi:Flp pilus assembly pilin Flp